MQFVHKKMQVEDSTDTGQAYDVYCNGYLHSLQNTSILLPTDSENLS